MMDELLSDSIIDRELVNQSARDEEIDFYVSATEERVENLEDIERRDQVGEIEVTFYDLELEDSPCGNELTNTTASDENDKMAAFVSVISTKQKNYLSKH